MPRRSRRSRSPRAGRALLLVLVGVLIGAGAVYLGCRVREGDEGRRVEGPSASGSGTGEPSGAPGQPTTTSPPEGAQPPAEIAIVPGGGAHVALVIDDLGASLDPLAPLSRLGVPVSYAVLPFEEQTAAVVSELAAEDREILCHLPMEARNGADPGPGALRLGMAEDELARSTEAALAAVPGAVGVNNHMGSGLSADARSMESILNVLAGRGLFYLDSRTSPESVGYRIARSLGIPAAERQVFLDTDPAPEAIRQQFARLLELARTRGAAIAIGHPYPATLATLSRAVPLARDNGYRFVPVSYLLDQTGEPPE